METTLTNLNNRKLLERVPFYEWDDVSNLFFPKLVLIKEGYNLQFKAFMFRNSFKHKTSKTAYNLNTWKNIK